MLDNNVHCSGERMIDNRMESRVTSHFVHQDRQWPERKEGERTQEIPSLLSHMARKNFTYYIWTTFPIPQLLPKWETNNQSLLGWKRTKVYLWLFIVFQQKRILEGEKWTSIPRRVGCGCWLARLQRETELHHNHRSRSPMGHWDDLARGGGFMASVEGRNRVT